MNGILVRSIVSKSDSDSDSVFCGIKKYYYYGDLIKFLKTQ